MIVVFGLVVSSGALWQNCFGKICKARGAPYSVIFGYKIFWRFFEDSKNIF